MEGEGPEGAEEKSEATVGESTARKGLQKARWRACHAFIALNKATQVPPFPQGDLLRKQQRMAGKCWTSVLNFAARYYAIEMDEAAIPYTAFFVEGRGFYVYLRMPFRLTGAPMTFCKMVLLTLNEMIGRELKNWMDDVCLARDDFKQKLCDLTKFFERCREKKLSLAPGKCKLFQTEVLFAEALISAKGVGSNRKKVAAVLDWPRPTNMLQLMGFLRLTNTF